MGSLLLLFDKYSFHVSQSIDDKLRIITLSINLSPHRFFGVMLIKFTEPLGSKNSAV